MNIPNNYLNIQYNMSINLLSSGVIPLAVESVATSSLIVSGSSSLMGTSFNDQAVSGVLSLSGGDAGGLTIHATNNYLNLVSTQGVLVSNSIVANANAVNSGFVYANVPVVTGSGTTGVCNGVMGVIAFTGSTILAGASSTFTITNNCAGTWGHVTAEFVGSSGTSAPYVQYVAWTPNTSIAVTVVNGGSATTGAMTVRFTFSKLA